MKDLLVELLGQALAGLVEQDVIQTVPDIIEVERTKDKRHGDYASNVALGLAKVAKMSPRDLAEKIVLQFPDSDLVEKVEIAGPGFINLFVSKKPLMDEIGKILDVADQYGLADFGAGQKVMIEYVSANPTGPLHVGHGRGAAYGATVANLLEAAGYDVHREYYVNDAGRQMDILALSIWLRYLTLWGEEIAFPSKGYQSEGYVVDIAQSLFDVMGKRFFHAARVINVDLPEDGEDEKAERYLDALIGRMKHLLGDELQRVLVTQGLQSVLDDIKDDLAGFGVRYDEWFSERQLVEGELLPQVIERLKETSYTYEKDGALWFAASKLGDEKDRVLVRNNGQFTYFASDVAYHVKKYEQGYDSIINVWGADHHGYVPRVRAAIEALGYEHERLEVLLVQFATLYRGLEKVSMSTRSGEYVTLRELRDEIGNDATRFFYVLRKSAQHMDFDLELAKASKNENPLYYIQYAHARMCSVMRQCELKLLSFEQDAGLNALNKLTHELETAVLEQVVRYPEIIVASAKERAPHMLIQYLRDLAGAFHSCYNSQKVLVDDDDLRQARLVLGLAVRQVLANGLAIIGVSAPEKM